MQGRGELLSDSAIMGLDVRCRTEANQPRGRKHRRLIKRSGINCDSALLEHVLMDPECALLTVLNVLCRRLTACCLHLWTLWFARVILEGDDYHRSMAQLQYPKWVRIGG